MARTLLLILALMSYAASAFAQKPIVLSERLLDSLRMSRIARSELLTFDVVEMDLGNIPDDKVYSSEFRFVNHTADTVKLVRVVSSCRCLSHIVPVRVIPPGMSGRVTALYNPYRHLGPFEQRLELYTAESGAPTAVLKVKGCVQPCVSEHPVPKDEKDIMN